jgi:hypothetical protein
VAEVLGTSKLAAVATPSIYAWLEATLRGVVHTLPLESQLVIEGSAVAGCKDSAGGMGRQLCHTTRKICFLYSLLQEHGVERSFHIVSTAHAKYAESSAAAAAVRPQGFGPHMRSVSAVIFEGRHGTAEQPPVALPSPIAARGRPGAQHSQGGGDDSFEVLGWVARFRAATAYYTVSSVHEKVVLGMVSVELTPAELECLPVVRSRSPSAVAVAGNAVAPNLCSLLVVLSIILDSRSTLVFTGRGASAAGVSVGLPP